MASGGREALLLVGAVLLATSGGIHFRLHREQYRDIHLDQLLGIDFADSFVLAVTGAAIVSTLLVASVVLGAGHRLAALAGVGYAVGSIAAYGLARTVGLLGFEENRWITEALVAKPIELVAVLVLLLAVRADVRSPAPA